MHTDPHGNFVIPKWVLALLSIALTLLSFTAIPWAVSVSRSLNLVSTDVAKLQTQLQGRIDLDNEVMRNIYDRMERIEQKVDRVEQWQRAKNGYPEEGRK